MSDFRYSDTARRLDDELVEEFKAAGGKKEPEPTHDGEHALDRIAKGKTPLDEVKALIDATTHKSAADEIREHGVRQKLAAIKSRGPEAVDSFLTLATKET